MGGRWLEWRGDQDLISTNTANLGILSMIIKHSSLNNDLRKIVAGNGWTQTDFNSRYDKIDSMESL